MASDALNPATADWYHYNFLSHLLESRDHLYVTRTAENQYAKFAILSYYCPGLSGGVHHPALHVPIGIERRAMNARQRNESDGQ